MEWSDHIGSRIRLRDLHILLTVVQQGSMGRAAKYLAVSQPVVSKVIADLEHALGVRVLDRDRHGAEPTIYGAALLKHGVIVFDELRQSVRSIEFLTDPTAGELAHRLHQRHGYGPTSGVISLLHRRHPRLTFHIVQANSVATLYRDLRERKVDLVLGRISVPFVEADLSAEPLFTDSFLVVAGRGSRWIGRRKIELTDLIHEPWLLPPTGTAGEAISFRCISGVWFGDSASRRRVHVHSDAQCFACERPLPGDATGIHGALRRQAPFDQGSASEVAGGA